ncbi:DUF3801 domain-containing protein [Streptococcus sp. S784/96/1]|uniref:DUF3801 domain-containing protein n=1 Tax=Streptococcus sp. S784/96/1 TaxID=2653499 RepID=UPI0013868C5A|nr:DUF3801 domain-containing protein [Streptococcus sp. S784/96/1]
MEQERVVAQVGRSFVVTGEFFLKALYIASTKAADIYRSHHSHISYDKETSWNKFMATVSSKDVKDFLSHQVNLKALKSELERYGIGFAFHHHSDGSVSIAYDFKNKAVVETAFERVIAKITDQPQAVKEALKKPEHEQTLGEKIKEKEQTMADLIKQTQLNRQQSQVTQQKQPQSMTDIMNQTNTLGQEKSL